MLDDIPKYQYGDDHERFWLTFTTTLNGKWNAGYCTTDGAWFDEPRVEDADTLEEAIKKLAEDLHDK